MVRYDTQTANAPSPKGDVTLAIRDAVATITLERPSKINAMRLATWQALCAQVVAADRNPAVGVIVVRGSGKHFGAGNDIAALSTFPGNLADAREFATAWADGIQAVEDASKPVLMAIEGVCYGAALALSLAGDVRIASTSAVFSIPVAKLGALYLRSDFQRLVATIGMGQSKKLIYSSEVFGAEQAMRIGLVEEMFAEDRFEAELARLIETILSRSPFTLLRSKEMLREIGRGDIVRETSDSLAAFAESTQSSDFAEGINAFLARRTARFRAL
jgi:enoyl-CoA hydratase/carnithine racemase